MARWAEFNTDGDLLPYTWLARTLRAIKPTSLHGQLGDCSFDDGAQITAGRLCPAVGGWKGEPSRI